jgi:N-acetyl-anhydromuramyl-L-alanine amidase AmpD
VITAQSPFLGVTTISREGFVFVMDQYPASQDCLKEGNPGWYWDACIAHGVDPNFALAMFQHESSMGAAGTAVQTRSWGNTRSPSFGAVPTAVVVGRSGSFPAFASWLDGCISTVARLSSLVWPSLAPYGRRHSIQEVFDHPSGQVWAPLGDWNDPNGYLNAVLIAMNRNSDQSAQDVTATAMPVPPVYQDYLTINYTHGRLGAAPRAVVLHITAGESAAGAINWFKSSSSKVSSHYVIDRDGDIYAVVREQDTAWVNGVLEHPNRSIPIIDRWVTTNLNPNLETIGIEVAGYSSMAPSGQPPELVGYTQAQFWALDYLLPVLSARWYLRITPETCFGHNEISGTQRVNCPGLSDEEWARVYASGTTTPSQPSTANDAFDDWCAQWGDEVVWAGSMTGRYHWVGMDPTPVARTVGNRLLAFNGEVAIDVTGFTLDEWQEAGKATGQLQIY